MTDTLNIFISYGRADSRDVALRLRDDLLAVGYSVWLDVSEIPGGASWSQQIETAIEHCNVALALMSSAAYESQWCRAEQLRALRKGKRLIPLLVQADAERPLHLEHLNFLDFSDLEHYEAMFRDLLSDITAGLAFRRPATEGTTHNTKSPFKAPGKKARGRGFTAEKRNATAFRRTISDLRNESWLGARYWWPYFLFHFTDLQSTLKILQTDELPSVYESGGDFNSRWDKFVRLYFRPRTPDLYRAEGIRPITQQRGTHYQPIPIYLLFDLEAVICMPEARFSEGDPERISKTFKTPAMFRDMPFDMIYHDSWFMPDERDEVMMSRQAQVLIPDRLGLESLQYIWCRSSAEYETLHTLLPDAVWQRWRDKITARTDFNLFNRKWVYVERAALLDKQMRLRFNRCEDSVHCGPYTARVMLETAKGHTHEWRDDHFAASNDLIITFDKPMDNYTAKFYLDGDLIYAGHYTADDVPF